MQRNNWIHFQHFLSDAGVEWRARRSQPASFFFSLSSFSSTFVV
jgi:hypothetical protein